MDARAVVCSKPEDEDTGEVHYTEVACRQLDLDKCRCKNYGRRQRLVHDCVRLTPEKVPTLDWLPPTCGYRLVAENKDLYWWHPLISGDPDTVHSAGVSVRDRVLPEDDVGDPLSHLVDWPMRVPGEIGLASQEIPPEEPPMNAEHKPSDGSIKRCSPRRLVAASGRSEPGSCAPHKALQLVVGQRL